MRFLYNKCIIVFLLSATLLPISQAGYGQQRKRGAENSGFLTASFETNTIFYFHDQLVNAISPDDCFGSNNYLKLDYSLNKFVFGIQYEAYLPALQGYPLELKKADLTFKYASYKDENYALTVGDFYEVFGSGLLFRAWEERSLGINTALEGINLTYTFKDIASFKVIYGRPRMYMDYADSWARGVDLVFSLSSLFDWEKVNLSLEGSYLGKYENALGYEDFGSKSNVNGYSARFAFDAAGFTLKGETVHKSNDAAIYNGFSTNYGEACILETGYSGNGLGVLLTMRYLSNMEFHSERQSREIYTNLNYLPALTQQHSYLLASVNPYQAQGAGEIGGQFDLYYNVKRGSWLGGKRGMRVHLNFSNWYDPEKNPQTGERMLFFQDLNANLEKNWSSKLKTTLFYSWQIFNPITHGSLPEEWSSHATVADITYKFNRKHSLRCELQHLLTKQDDKNWAAILIEYNLAPKWSFMVSDMWNYGSTKVHEFNGGITFSHGKTKTALFFGRFKEGYQCSGGVCRIIPAYSGINFSFTTSF